VADALGCTTRSADYRLRKLRDAGHVESKKVGRTLVWTLADSDAAGWPHEKD
jgi:predicted transcriptional regulator